jgi:Poxvirus Late Transcription Factor VLTF3 like
MNHIASTIDEKHTELLNEFHKNETIVIPELKMKIIEKKKMLLTTLKIEDYMDIKDEIESLQHNKKYLRSLKKKYLIDNSKHIFNYFEEKKDISEGGGVINVNVLNNFFNCNKSALNSANNTKNAKYSTSKNKYHAYWKNVNDEITSTPEFITNDDVCRKCNKGELVPHEEEGILICNNRHCGIFMSYIVDCSKPANKEPPNEVSYTAYIRLNHFKEILSQFQAKETTQIPEEVINAIRNRIIKERITDTTTLTYDKMRDILRKLGFNKYFEHIQYINSIFGIKPPIMNEELHETLCVLFIEIQKPWAIHCPPNRTNFFNYTYTLYQLCVLLDQKQYIPYIVQLKDDLKRREQDQIWKLVCESLNWEYYPSI